MRQAKQGKRTSMDDRHRHEVESEQMRGYLCCVDPYGCCNEGSHGNVMYVERCACGATRKRNVNGSHHETGPWTPAEE